MKLIHCADLHLDSNLNSFLNEEKAKERRNELLETFFGMVEYALNNDVTGIIIAGDLFDKKNISATARNAVMNRIVNNPELDFYYLRGNHDESGFWGDLEVLPENLHIFGKEWTSYTLFEKNGRRITINGVELSKENSGEIYSGLILNAADYNIVVLHGQESENVKKGAQIINLRELKNRSIDYLALGHIHSYKEAALDGRGVYCYAGCLEGRGFDECGEHGFVVLDIDEESFTGVREFVSSGGRNLFELEVDITGCKDSMDISERINTVIEACCYGKNNLVKIILTGAVDVECEVNLDFLSKHFADEFYYTRIKNDSSYSIDYENFSKDCSLKGEFVRRVMAEDSLNEDEKAQVIRYGILALRGEEI